MASNGSPRLGNAGALQDNVNRVFPKHEKFCIIRLLFTTQRVVERTKKFEKKNLTNVRFFVKLKKFASHEALFFKKLISTKPISVNIG